MKRLRILLTALVFLLSSHGLCFALPVEKPCCDHSAAKMDCHQSHGGNESLTCCTIQHQTAVPSPQQSGASGPLPVAALPLAPRIAMLQETPARQEAIAAQQFFKDQTQRYLELRVLLN